ncbi:13452_t:CDS:2, partial [Dentiscutata heterogama]
NDDFMSNLNPSYQRTILNLEPSHQRINRLSQFRSFPGNRSTFFTKNTRNYDMSKAAAIRMVLFASFFALINLLASTGAVIGIINGHPIPTGLTVTDWVGGFQGILIIIVFGLPNNWKRFLLKVFKPLLRYYKTYKKSNNRVVWNNLSNLEWSHLNDTMCERTETDIC